jgi:hypothetical protein
MSDRWTQAVVWDVEIDKRAAHENSGGMDLLVESVLAVDEENVKVSPGEQARTLKPGKSGADDSHIVARSHDYLPSYALAAFSSSTLRGKENYRLITEKIFF